MFKYLFIALFLSLLPIQTKSYLWSVHAYNKNTQKVLVLGDDHVPCAADVHDKLLITTLFTQCAERKKPAQVLIEHIPYTWYLLTDEDQKIFDQYTHKDYMPLMGYISQYALWCDYSYKSLKFSQSDLRYSSEIFRFLVTVRTALCQYIEQKTTNKNVTPLTQEQKTELTPWITDTLEQTNIYTYYESSYQELFIALDSLISYCTHLQTYLQAYRHDRQFQQLLQNIASKIQEFKNQLQAFSRQYNTLSILTSIDAYIAASTTTQDIEKLIALYKPLIEEIADLGFIKELFDALSTNNDIILCTGNWHSTAINQTLQALGFTCTQTHYNLPQEPTAARQQALLSTIEEFMR